MADWRALLHEQVYIHGVWRDAKNGARIAVENPATGDTIGHVPNVGAAETSEAIEAAHTAFLAHRAIPVTQRVAWLRALHTALLENAEALATLITMEQGKPLAEARGEIQNSANYVLWFAEEARRMYGDIVPSPLGGRRLLVSHHPVGVVAAITPWNFPSSMLARKIAPALAAGCAVVAKPSELTPFSALAWAHLCEAVGIPHGLVNIITGDAATIGGVLMKSTKVRKITFTGSTATGKILMAQAADTVKRASMELGGNAPFIVFADADKDDAVAGAIAAKFRNSGQTCVCANRFYIEAPMYDAFVAALAENAQQLTVGDGRMKDTQQGPLITKHAVSRMGELVADAIAKGARLVCGGETIGEQFFAPTVLADATPDMRVFQEEIFGPIAAVARFHDEAAAIEAANNTPHGLAAYAYTKDMARMFRLNDALDFGLIGFNAGLIATVEAPFGGLKESGLGKEGSRYGLAEYLDIKYAALGGLGNA